VADWVLVPCLVALRSEFNRIAPARDKASDGSIGDAAHRRRSSDHNPDETGTVPIRDADRLNEVHGLDVDVNLRRPGLTMERVVQHILARCRSGAEKRLRYIIFNRRIWEASNDWRERAYSGDNPHTEHAHFSASYDTAREASTASWHLSTLTQPKGSNVTTLDSADHTAIRADVASIVDDRATLKTYNDGAAGSGSAIGRAVINSGVIARTGEQRIPLYTYLLNLQTQIDGIQATVQGTRSLVEQLVAEPGDGNPLVAVVQYVFDQQSQALAAMRPAGAGEGAAPAGDQE